MAFRPYAAYIPLGTGDFSCSRRPDQILLFVYFRAVVITIYSIIHLTERRLRKLLFRRYTFFSNFRVSLKQKNNDYISPRGFVDKTSIAGNSHAVSVCLAAITINWEKFSLRLKCKGRGKFDDRND